MNERFADVGDVRICFETFGHHADPAVLLVMGLGTQMLGWHEDLCRELAGRGFHVIRYDNRDCGHSTHFDQVPPPRTLELATRNIKNLPYTLEDMAADGIGLLDNLGIERAHVVGASMGGMIAQVMAGRHRDRVLSLTSIMSTTGSRRVGNPALKVYPFFLGQTPRSKEAFLDRIVKLFGIIGSPGFPRDESELREVASQSFERDPSPAGTPRQLAAILAAGDRTADVKRIAVPTTVIHGDSDRMVSKSGGRATARAIQGAKLLLIEGMGHDLPRALWPRIIDAVAETAARAETGVPAWQRN
jgi:pimeloyl-ACP methyl ester carboxylesterase